MDYNGYTIEYDIYRHGEYSVYFMGDDFVFKTKEEAMKFIDEITK